MTNPGGLSPWPGYPEIPIFLDTGAERNSPPSQRTTATSFETNNSDSPVSPLNVPHFIRVTPPTRSANYSFKTPNRASTQQCNRQYLQQQPRTTSTRFLSPVDGPEKQYVPWQGQTPSIQSQDSHIVQESHPASHFRFGDFPSSHKTEKGTPPFTTAPTSGLGIMNSSYGTVNPHVYPSDVKEENSTNIVQRIEDTLWRYSVSGNVFKRWLLEIISWVISAICMAGIVGVLLRLKDKKSSEWPLAQVITLNTYVAVLSRIASAALLLPVSEALGQLKWSWFFQGESKKMWDFEIFDNASRGPWGSFQLLIRTKGRKLAALGAAIVLFALALDPFFQQVLDFPDRNIVAGKSFVPKAFRYEPNYAKKLVAGSEDYQNIDEFVGRDANLQFYNDGVQQKTFGHGRGAGIPVSCPTNNCTWEPYETLGVCSACEDVSDLLFFECRETTVDWIGNLTGFGTEDTYPNGTVCGYFFNVSGQAPILMSGYSLPNQSFDEEVLLMRTLPLLSNPMKVPLVRKGSIKFQDFRNTIMDALIVGARDGVESVKRHEAPFAHECVLTWCIKTLNSTYNDAIYEEEVLDTFINKTIGDLPWDVVKEVDSEGTFYDTYYTQNIVLEPPSRDPKAPVYGLANETQVNLIQPFDDFFPSFYTKTDTYDEPLLRMRVWSDAGPFQRNLPSDTWMTDAPGQLERLAKSMTDTVRSAEDTTQVTGTAYQKENFVDVRFEWLVLPVGLLLFSAIFLLATVVRTSREKEHVGVWKTSAVATLLYGLPDDIQKKMASAASSGTPRATAKQLKVQLHPGKGWRVSGNLFSPLTPKVRQYQPPPGWI